MNLKIGKVGVIKEVDFIAIVFQDEDEERYFQIQDAYAYDEQDISLGMNKYYIELIDQCFGSYGGIESIQRNPSELRIGLDSAGEKKLNTSEIIMEIEEVEFIKIQRELMDIFSKHQIEIEILR